MMRPTFPAILLAIAAFAGAPPASADPADSPAPPAQRWSFSGLSGRIDQDAARRGFQVFSDSCAACHALTYLHYRDLAGIGFTEDQIRAMAAKAMVPTGTDLQGRPVLKRATPASAFRAPFATEDAARAAFNGALPPDLSLAINSFPNGADTIYAILTGYADPPPGTNLPDGMSYNAYAPGHILAMPPPLADNIPQSAHDVVTFLYWAANPETNERKHLGGRVILYFLGMAGIAYGLQKRIWARVQDET